VGLTGGIGSGKSSVSAGLARRGAVIIDADRVAREVVEPGGPAYRQVVGRFGPGIVAPDGRIDRPALAAVVFADRGARADLNAITHPSIWHAIVERVAGLAGAGRTVVLDLPLLDGATVEAYRLALVVVVDAPEDVAVGRLVAQRGFTEADARARVAAQVSREERRLLADVVIDNSGDRVQLEAQVGGLWEQLEALRRGG